MALIGNYSLLNKSFERPIGGQVASGNRSSWNTTGGMRNWGKQTGLNWRLAAVPKGFGPGGAWLLPVTAGAMVSRREARITISGAAAGASGLPGSATGSFTVEAAAVGGLIAGGVAVGTITISGSANIAGLAAGKASGEMSITGSAALGATAWGVANGAMTFSGSAQPYALGYMAATTADNTALTPASITSAVWSASKTDYNAAGSMGNALNNASSGGVDYAALSAAVWADATRSMTVAERQAFATEVWNKELP